MLTVQFMLYEYVYAYWESSCTAIINHQAMLSQLIYIYIYIYIYICICISIQYVFRANSWTATAYHGLVFVYIKYVCVFLCTHEHMYMQYICCANLYTATVIHSSATMRLFQLQHTCTQTAYMSMCVYMYVCMYIYIYIYIYICITGV